VGAKRPTDKKRPKASAKTRAAAPRAAKQKAPQPMPTPSSPQPALPLTAFPIVGIGASAGGLAAFEAFFSAMPPNTESGIAIVLVQHLSPDHKSILVELVKRYTRMQVFEVENGMRVRPNCAYIIPPNRNMSLSDSVLSLTEPTEPRGLRLPIDFFFRSLAAAHHERAICVVLSGTGSDGALGVRAIKGEGGMVMVQSPDTAEHDGMPRSAIGTGLVDYVLPPAQMPKQLIAYVRHAFARGHQAMPATRDGDFIRKLCALLRAQTGHDFSQYKETTLVRRLERRMALQQIDHPEEYLRHARENPAEVDALFRDLLIGVTNFFRDAEAFKMLAEKVLPRILADKPLREAVRVWVCGCSTGEEAYSIAILLQEQIEAMKRPLKVQVFATDIDRNAIEQARAGAFPASIVADVTPERLARYFIHDGEGGQYRIQKMVRDMLVFSEQDVVKDPPFSKLDLISCRNLLIYLNGELQKKLVPLFQYALRPGGALFLGPSETVGEYAPLFTAVDRKWKLYLRGPNEVGAARPVLTNFLPPLSDRSLTRPASVTGHEAERADLRQLIQQTLLAHYAHAAILINSRGDILHIVGRTGKFLEPAAGDAAMNILAMAREGLRRELTVALHKVVAQKQPVSYHGLSIKSNGGHIPVNLVVRPAQINSGEAAADLHLVIIEEATDRQTKPAGKEPARDPQTRRRIAELEQELRAKEEYLQTTLEEMETTNEELKSTNEEMQSVNEELQSTNEELETSKEELQSVNEELSTVNTELQDKVADLSRVNNDMNNLLAGTGVGTVFVDHQLRISRFTPAATQVINLIPSDVGRPVEHVVPNLVGYDRLIQDIRNVLSTLAPIEAEVQIKSGAWYLMRIRPYRTMENVIEGAVITLVDISERKRIENSLRASEARFHAFVSQAYAGVAETDPGGRFTYVNDKFSEMLGYARQELLDRTMRDVTHPDDLARSKLQLEALVAGGPGFEIENRYVCKDGAAAWVLTRVNAIREAGGAPQALIVIAFDITERKRLETELSRSDTKLGQYLDVISRLHAVGTMYSGESTLQAVLAEVVDAAIAISGADMGNVQLIDSASGNLVIAAHRGFEASWIEFWNTASTDAGACRAAFKKHERVIVEDVAESPIFSDPSAREMQLTAGVRAVQSTPLIDPSGRLIGVLSTHFRSRHRPDERTLRLLDLLARQTTDILARANADQQPKEP
jgi:two-component system CheB/CheR fusion protein